MFIEESNKSVEGKDCLHKLASSFPKNVFFFFSSFPTKIYPAEPLYSKVCLDLTTVPGVLLRETLREASQKEKDVSE